MSALSKPLENGTSVQALSVVFESTPSAGARHRRPQSRSLTGDDNCTMTRRDIRPLRTRMLVKVARIDDAS
ncbi:unnamed protein product [Nippostrongylus brasiliensis]|uniref:Uncharacterized protein n=1 Tax=Nippostrongylus brasiliensis TaxID=27835 RepID=A0A0N4YQN3_NIPBR|nr:unnamed protein product [Nippostrongylus brasiliensis]